MKEIKQGDIFLIQFSPGTGHEFQNTRPAVIISSDALIKRSNLVTCIPLTANLSNRIADDLLIKKTSGNNLFTDSILKMHHICSFDKCRMVKYVGKLGVEDMGRVISNIRKNFLA